MLAFWGGMSVLRWFGVLSSMNQYSKVFVIWFLMRIVVIGKLKMSFKVVWHMV